MKAKHKNIGSDFDNFLKEENILEKVELIALKRVLAFQIEKAMKNRHMTKSAMATKMKTNRATVDRLFDPENTSLTLMTLSKAAAVLDKKIKIELVSASKS
jgi:antitoxin HicB